VYKLANHSLATVQPPSLPTFAVMAILNYVIGTLLMHHGRLAFHVQDGPDGPHHSKPIEAEPVDPVGMALTITIICIYLILSNLVNDSCR
jgi:multisubunit Na+/H+ antiporter MnhC subunit